MRLALLPAVAALAVSPCVLSPVAAADAGGRPGPAQSAASTGACDAHPESCCPDGSTIVQLSNGDDVFQNVSPGRCILGLGGRDTIYTLSEGSSAAILGPGDDVVMAGPGPHVLVGGDGNDTIYVWGGDHSIYGNAGDDVIFAGNGNNFVVPGPGADTVTTGSGDDIVAIYDLCEVAAGEKLDAGDGFDTLISPVPAAELQARGVSLTGFENVVVAHNSCLSQCAPLPKCSGHGVCGEGAGSGEVRCVCDTGFAGPECASQAGFVSGRVFWNAAPAPGVSVRLRPLAPAGSAPREQVTDAEGRFAFEPAAVGSYALEARQTGDPALLTASVPRVDVLAGASASFDLVLEDTVVLDTRGGQIVASTGSDPNAPHVTQLPLFDDRNGCELTRSRPVQSFESVQRVVTDAPDFKGCAVLVSSVQCALDRLPEPPPSFDAAASAEESPAPVQVTLSSRLFHSAAGSTQCPNPSKSKPVATLTVTKVLGNLTHEDATGQLLFGANRFKLLVPLSLRLNLLLALCGTQNQTCNPGGCCTGLVCNNGGLCVQPVVCNEGASCNVPGLKGACAVGRLSCVNPSQPVCQQVVFPKAEICNRVDDNCDGKIDETFPEMNVTCNASVGECPGRMVPGKQLCTSGRLSCQATRCNTNDASATNCYCTIAGSAIGGNGKPCGEAIATPCIPGLTRCTPNAACTGAGNDTQCRIDPLCGAGNAFPACWTPQDVELPPNHCL